MQAVGLPAEEVIPLAVHDAVGVQPNAGEVPSGQKHDVRIEAPDEVSIKFGLHEIVKHAAGGDGDVSDAGDVVAADLREAAGLLQGGLAVYQG